VWVLEALACLRPPLPSPFLLLLLKMKKASCGRQRSGSSRSRSCPPACACVVVACVDVQGEGVRLELDTTMPRKKDLVLFLARRCSPADENIMHAWASPKPRRRVASSPTPHSTTIPRALPHPHHKHRQAPDNILDRVLEAAWALRSHNSARAKQHPCCFCFELMMTTRAAKPLDFLSLRLTSPHAHTPQLQGAGVPALA